MTHPFYLRVRTILSLGCAVFGLVLAAPATAQTSESDSQKGDFLRGRCFGCLSVPR